MLRSAEAARISEEAAPKYSQTMSNKCCDVRCRARGVRVLSEAVRKLRFLP